MIGIEAANRLFLFGSLQLPIDVLILCAVVGFDRQPTVSPELSLGAKAIRRQGLRMKNACEDLAHVLVVPSGYFSSSAQAVP